MAEGEQIGPRRIRWERWTAVPMFIVAAAFITAYSFLVLMPELPIGWVAFLLGVIFLTWAASLVDFLVRLALSPHHRWAFVRHNLLDLLAVIMPFFRAF